MPGNIIDFFLPPFNSILGGMSASVLKKSVCPQMPSDFIFGSSGLHAQVYLTLGSRNLYILKVSVRGRAM